MNPASTPSPKQPSQQSVMARLATLSRDKADTLLLIFSCCMVLAPFTVHIPLLINASAAILIFWRIWLTLSGRVLPEKWILLFISATILAGIYLHFHTWLGRDPGIAFLLVLSCLKMLEMHGRRDAIAVIFVGYFLLAGQLLYSQSILTALHLLLCLCLLMSTQLAYQYRESAPPFFVRLRQGFKIVALAIPLALLFFLLFPRFQGPLWGKQQGNSIGTTGLSDTMEPGNVAELALSDQIAFRVKFKGFIPPPNKLYWRAIVLDKFDGKRWTESSDGTQPISALSVEPLAANTVLTQEIIMEPNNQHWLFALDTPTSIAKSSTIPFDSYLTQYSELRNRALIQDRIQYTVSSSLIASSGKNLTTAPIALPLHHHFLLLPDGYNPLTLKWAEQIKQQSTNPLELANSVLNFFHEQPFRYTLAPPPTGSNQVDDFLFITQAGFCEHYASAFVIVMRSMGIPARVVTGYQGGEVNPIDGLMTVRQSDAHAWAEIWTDSRGWVRVDPTAAVAPNRVERGINGSFPNRNFSGYLNFNKQSIFFSLSQQLLSQWDAVNSAWNLWILNYNLEKQKNLLSSITGIEHPQDAQLGIAMMTGALLITAIISLFLLYKKKEITPLDKIYLRFCSYMANQGFPRMPHEGALDYSLRLQAAFSRAKVLQEFLTLYTQCKYGKSYNTSQLHTLKKLLSLCLQLKPSRD